jgi:hypothetical protein
VHARGDAKAAMPPSAISLYAPFVMDLSPFRPPIYRY